MMTLLSSIFGVNAQQPTTVNILDANAFKQAVSNNKVQLVDVRTSTEFIAGAIKGAINIDFFQKTNFTQAFDKLDKNAPVYVYCRSGNRSYQAALKLDAIGFKKIYDLKGGYMAYPYK